MRLLIRVYTVCYSSSNYRHITYWKNLKMARKAFPLWSAKNYLRNSWLTVYTLIIRTLQMISCVSVLRWINISEIFWHNFTNGDTFCRQEVPFLLIQTFQKLELLVKEGLFSPTGKFFSLRIVPNEKGCNLSELCPLIEVYPSHLNWIRIERAFVAFCKHFDR